MARRAVAVVKELFFAARIRETARLTGVDAVMAPTPADLGSALWEPTDLVIIDLTTPGRDYDAFFEVMERALPRPPVLGFTSHVLARETRAWHPWCDRVVTRETLTRELGGLLQHGLAFRPAASEVDP